MSATTYFHKHENQFLARLLAGAKSFGASLVAARQAQADHLVNNYLASLDDEALARMGIDRESVRKAPLAFPVDY